MPIYEIRYFDGTNQYTIEGLGYWCNSRGEFIKINFPRDINETIIQLRLNDNGAIQYLAWDREFIGEEAQIYDNMKAVLAVLVATSHFKGS